MKELRLNRKFYPTQNNRIEGMGSKGWWFTGGSSFVSNGYVIYTSGLDGWLPNPNALLQGETFDTRMFDTRSMDKRSSYYQFINQLQQIAARAAANESAFLKSKMAQLQSSDIDVNYLDKIEQAINACDYSSAYTLLLKRQKDLEAFKREVNSNKNHSFAKTNEFFNSQFYKYLANKLEQQLVNQSGDIRIIKFEEDFDTFVDGFLNQVLGVSLEDNQSLEFIRNQLINQLKTKFPTEKFNIRWKGELAPDSRRLRTYDGSNVKFKRNIVSTGKKDANGHYKSDARFRSPKELANKIAYELIGNIGRGLSQEVYVVGALGDIGARAYSTGNETMTRIDYFGNVDDTRQGKVDVRGYDVYSATISIDDIINDMYRDGYEQTGQEFYNELDRRILEIASKDDESEFFKIAVNVKGYLSNFDLSIEGEGTFANRLGVINRLPLEGGMSEKLVFMLNNTTEDCIASGRQGEIADYLAAVCVAWMWDNNDDLFNIETAAPSNFHTIYLFNSGGAYFTASQIIQQTVDRLMNYDNDPNRFVDVKINPPSSYQGYDALIDQYPGTGIQSKDAWDAMLQKMWETVKNDALNSGTIAIHFKQDALNDLLSGLNGILNS